MLQPKRVKYRKHHRGHRRGMAMAGNEVSFGEIGLQATTTCWIDSRQIEAARRAITHHLRRGGRCGSASFPTSR
jgi:large subunit ribosomal protein L16